MDDFDLDDVLSQGDTLAYAAAREDVESGNIGPALDFLNRLLRTRMGKHFKGRLLFGVSGYDNDPRELYQIPEVRLWMRKLDQQFPYWFYFLSRDASTMEFVTFSLCDCAQTPQGALISPEALTQFLYRHFPPMNEMCHLMREPAEESERLYNEIMGFYRG